MGASAALTRHSCLAAAVLSCFLKLHKQHVLIPGQAVSALWAPGRSWGAPRRRYVTLVVPFRAEQTLRSLQAPVPLRLFAMVSPVPQMDESASTVGDGTVGAEAADSKMPSKAQRARTEDIYTDKTFADLGLPANVVAALSACGYDRPSPVQQHAIPLGLLGSDLIVQAKSGTGKTVVFAVILLQRLKPEEKHVQVRAARSRSRARQALCAVATLRPKRRPGLQARRQR